MTKTRSKSRPSVTAPVDTALSGIQMLIDDLTAADVTRREKARKDLVSLGPMVVEPLVAALKARDDRYRWRILIVLSDIADKRAVPGVMACLSSGNPAIRTAAVQFLGNIGAVEAVDPLLELLQNSPSDQSTIWIIQALGRLGDKRAVSLLVDIMHATESSAVRYTAIEALTAIGDVRVVRDIRRYATDPSHHVQTRAVTALEKLTRV